MIYPVMLDASKYWKVFYANRMLAKRGKKTNAFNAVVYRDKVRADFQKLLIHMCNVLPLTETEIRSKTYIEFFSLVNRCEEIVKARKNDKK